MAQKLLIALFCMAALGGMPGLAMAQAPACAEQSVSTSTRSDPGIIDSIRTVANGGIGGTGDRARGGIGGTGIVGTVTGFASVCINGLEVHYDPTTPVTRNGLPADLSTLAIGQVIAIDTTDTPKGLSARRISILNVLEGPVTSITPGSGGIMVMNQTVHIDASTHLDGWRTPDELQNGMLVRVAGFRDARGAVHATRIEAAPDLLDSSVLGVPVESLAGGVNLSGLPIQTATPLPGTSEVLLRGQWNGHHLITRAVHPEPMPFAGHADRVSVESLVLERKDPAHLRITGFDVKLTSETRVSGDMNTPLKEGQRIQVTGRLEGRNRIVAHGITISGRPHGREPGTTPLQHKPGNAMSGDRAAMMERMSSPDRPQRMEHMPMSRPNPPPGTRTPRM